MSFGISLARGNRILGSFTDHSLRMTTGVRRTIRTMIKKLKTCLIAVAAVAGFSLPAIAGPIAVNVTNVQVIWGQGQGLTIQEGANPTGIYYAGPIIFTINGAKAPI